VSLMIS